MPDPWEAEQALASADEAVGRFDVEARVAHLSKLTHILSPYQHHRSAVTD